MRIRSLGLLCLCVFLFQNCGSFEAIEQGSDIAPFSQPNFFFDIQLVRVDVDELKRERHIFDIVVSLASNPEAPVDYLVNFSTVLISGVCPSVQGIAEGATKHFRVQCTLPTPDELFVQLKLTGPSSETITLQYGF